jgi:two-component system, NtrC family, response regulator HydG
MRPEDLHHEELLEVDDEGGRVMFAGQRAIVLDTVALGFLQKYLVENFGRAAARAVMTQFGFAHGWRLADALSTGFTWETADDWRRAGLRIMSLQGLFSVRDLVTRGPHYHATLVGSYEAEQHVLQFGRGSSVACWTVAGLLSGYASRVEGSDFVVLEERCTASGAVACHFAERPRAEWGVEQAEALKFFEHGRLKDCLDGSLVELTEALKRTESHLMDRQRILSRVATRGSLDAETHDELHYPIHRSEAMSRVVDVVRRVAKVDSTVLITGESGTGKERIARLIHDESVRAAGPFVAVNCSAMTETLLESEFFGHVRGAFTGANQDRPGLFEAATKGTLFLDEVGETSQGLQVKLLRALQEREIRRVGENHSRKIDVRVVAATNQDLQQGTFRQDLFFRLNVVEINIPPLRERHEDILPLARLFLEEMAHRMKREPLKLSPAAADALVTYGWPGNVRELQNAIERAVAMAEGNRIEARDLPIRLTERAPKSSPPSSPQSGPICTLAALEREHILRTLQHNQGNQAATAEQLKIGTATLYRKLKSYGATTPRRVKASPTEDP